MPFEDQTVNDKSLVLQKRNETLKGIQFSEEPVIFIWKILQIEILKLLWLKIIAETTTIMNKNGLVIAFDPNLEDPG